MSYNLSVLTPLSRLVDDVCRGSVVLGRHAHRPARGRVYGRALGTCRAALVSPRRGGHYQYRHAHTRAADMPVGDADIDPSIDVTSASACSRWPLRWSCSISALYRHVRCTGRESAGALFDRLDGELSSGRIAGAWLHARPGCYRYVRSGRAGSISALSRHRRRHAHCAGMGVPVLKMTASGARRGGHFEYRHAHTRAMDVPSAMPI